MARQAEPSIAAALAITGPSQAFKAIPAIAKDNVHININNADGVAIGRDSLHIVKVDLHEVGKHEFLEKLQGEQSMLLNFYEDGNKESDEALKEFEAFAKRAAFRYPDLYIGKVNFKTNPYLTARLLLTGIPELRLIVKNQDGGWAAYNPEISEGADELVEYMDNQQWYLTEPVGSKQQLYCSPFNFCGKILAVIADKGSVIDKYVPLPKWLAVIMIPALITFAGRFIIEGMYATENRVRALFRVRQAPAVSVGDENSSQASEQAESTRVKKTK
ncbi:hypothetical protein EV178_003063 [Coemansia sp. RSA 1646]|nr:hypothetical protein EV178_003063 [Coemansia sp. RSA 1646]